MARDFRTEPTVNGNKVFHAGNDGAGSGLDADTLDGVDSTGFAPATHVGSRDGHPVATPSLDGFESAADKAKLDGIESGVTLARVGLLDFVGSYTITLAASTWTRMNNGTKNTPRFDFAALPAAPSGTAWRGAVNGIMRVRSPSAATVYFGVQVNAGSMGAVHGGVKTTDTTEHVAAFGNGALTGIPTGAAFTLDFAIFGTVAGDYTVIASTLTAFVYLVKL